MSSFPLSETTDPFNTPPRDPRSVRAVTAIVLDINLSLAHDPPADTQTDSGCTYPRDVEGCE